MDTVVSYLIQTSHHNISLPWIAVDADHTKIQGMATKDIRNRKEWSKILLFKPTKKWGYIPTHTSYVSLRLLWWELPGKPLTSLSRERWGEGVDAKAGRTIFFANVERLNYTSCTLCSKKDRRGDGNVDRKANLAIHGANGRRKQGSLNRAYQTRKNTLTGSQ